MSRRLIAAVIGVVFFLSLASVSQASLSSKRVTHIQKDLIALGYQCASTGKLDEATVAAVKQFQTDHGLKVDGKYGPQTRKALITALREKSGSEKNSSQ